jgi:uncharacterized protein
LGFRWYANFIARWQSTYRLIGASLQNSFDENFLTMDLQMIKKMKKTSVLLAIGIFWSIKLLFGQEKTTTYFSNEDLNNYLGVYSCNQIRMKIKITKDDTILIAQAYGQSSFPLEVTEKDKFKSDKYDLKMEFNISKNEMILNQHGNNFLFAKENKKNHEGFITDTFNFVFEGKELSGFINIPVSRDPSALIIIVPGHEKTNFEIGYWAYDSLIYNFTNLGISCFCYDKAGCGKSEGEYDHNQTVQSSAEEIIAAITELKRRNIKGSDKIGLWGISRGGYICPLVIQKDSSISFWISISGPDGLDSSPYRIESDLIFAGLPASKAKLFVAEYLAQNALIENGGTYQEYVYLKSKQEFRKDDFFMNYMNIDREFPESLYNEYQKNLKVNYKRENQTNICIIVSDFDSILSEINCPVLAIFGEKDYVVDWQKTLSLYKMTIGKNNNKKLTIKTFPDGNHGIRKCRTGASNEVIENEEFCDSYIETMTIWLKENGFGK